MLWVLFFVGFFHNKSKRTELEFSICRSDHSFGVLQNSSYWERCHLLSGAGSSARWSPSGTAAGQGQDLTLPRPAVGFLFPPPASLAVIKTHAAMFIEEKELLQEGIGIIFFLHE